MTRVKITGGRTKRPETKQSKADPQRRLKNPSRGLTPWRAKARGLGLSRSFALRSKCQLGSKP